MRNKVASILGFRLEGLFGVLNGGNLHTTLESSTIVLMFTLGDFPGCGNISILKIGLRDCGITAQGWCLGNSGEEGL